MILTTAVRIMSMPIPYSEVAQAEAVGPGNSSSVRFNGEGGVRKEWWWEAGPVDS